MTRKLIHCLVAVQILPSSVIDGDSIRKIDIPLGLNVTVTKNLRLDRIDAPEISEENGLRSKERLKELIGFCKDTSIEIRKIDAFGRALVELYCDGKSINTRLLKEGYAKPYKKRGITK